MAKKAEDLRQQLDRLGVRRELADEDAEALQQRTREVARAVKAQADPRDKEAVTITEAAHRLGISRQALYELIGERVAA